jgi:hypothetical protein
MIERRMRHLRLVNPPAPLERRRAALKRELLPLDPVVQAMLEHVRIIVPLPRFLRARALARARAAIAAQHR